MSDFQKYQKKAKRLKLLEEMYEAVIAMIALADAGMDVHPIAKKLYEIVVKISETNK